MAMSLQERLRAARAETERWIRQRETQLRRGASELEARGRQVYADAIKTGKRVIAETPADVRRLGYAALTGQLPGALAETVVRRAAPHVKAAAHETVKFAKAATSADPNVRAKAMADAKEQLRAGVSGAVDEASFGLADRVLAAGDAVREGGLRDFTQNYSENMQAKRAEDAYDELHHERLGMRGGPQDSSVASPSQARREQCAPPSQQLRDSGEPRGRFERRRATWSTLAAGPRFRRWAARQPA